VYGGRVDDGIYVEDGVCSVKKKQKLEGSMILLMGKNEGSKAKQKSAKRHAVGKGVGPLWGEFMDPRGAGSCVLGGDAADGDESVFAMGLVGGGGRLYEKSRDVCDGVGWYVGRF